MSDRRGFFAKLAATGAGLVAARKLSAQPVAGQNIPVEMPDLTKLPYRIVDGVKEFHLVAEVVHTQLAPGREMTAWGYNGSVPGPLIEANEGDRIRVVFENKLPEMTALHWHGLEAPMEMEGSVGLGQDPIPPGGTYRYEFTLNQHGTLFYHSHFAMQEMMGQLGMMVVHPKAPYTPQVHHDFGLLIQEWALYPNNDVPNSMAMEFNWLTFNGKAGPATTPMLVKQGERVRVRLVNLGMDHHPIHIHGNQFVVTGTEGGRKPQPLWFEENTVLVGVGQARNIEFDAKYVGDWMMHCHMPHHMMNQMVSMAGPMTPSGHAKMMSSSNIGLFPADDPVKKAVPGYPQDMWMPMDDMIDKPENFGLRKGWTGAMMGMMTLIRVLPPDRYDEIMARKRAAQEKAVAPKIAFRGPRKTTRKDTAMNRRLFAGLMLMSGAALAQQQNAALKLEDLERMALAVSPSLQQSTASVRAAEGRAKQAGLYPNPVIGATGDHNSDAPGMRGGLFGGFVEQRIVTAGKLGLARRAGEQQTAAATQLQESERLRVLVTIRELYYQALGAQRLLEVRQELSQIAARTAQTARETANLGRFDRPDVLAAEVEAQRAELSVTLARNALDRVWREIGALTNQPGFQARPLEGDLEKLPPVDANALARIYELNPNLRATLSERASADLLVDRARVEKIPDVVARGGVRYNRELSAVLPGPATALGPEGFFDIGIQIPIFNRNQGALAAARAEAEQARLETDRQRQMLGRKFAAVFREYQDATAAAARYRDQMIPAATQAYELYTSNFGNMIAAYSQVLLTQRNLIQLREEYISALVTAWRSVVEIDGLLVSE